MLKQLDNIIEYIKTPMRPDKEAELNNCLNWVGVVVKASIEAYETRHRAEITKDTARHVFGKSLVAAGTVKVTEAYIDRAYVEDTELLESIKAINVAKEEETACEYLRNALQQKLQAVVAATKYEIK